MYFTDKHILFEFNQTIVLSRLIEGEYLKLVKCSPVIMKARFPLIKVIC